MSDGEGTVLGRVVFGTARGLFAIGTGILAGAAESVDAFELRAADPRRSLVPAVDRPILLRRALRLSTGGHVDLIAVANGAADLEKRPGFLGYGIAVEYGDHTAYDQAMDLLWEEFRPAFEHYAQGNRFREGAPPYAVPGEGRLAMPSLVDAGKKTPPILLTLPNWWDHPAFVTTLLDVGARWSGREAATIMIGAEERAGSFAATNDLIERMSEETEARAELERKAEDAADLERAGVNLGQDHIARRKIQRLEEQVRSQDREIKALKRQVFMLSAPKIAADGRSEQTPKGLRRFLENRWVLSGIAATGVGMILLIAVLFLLGREQEIANNGSTSGIITADPIVPSGDGKLAPAHADVPTGPIFLRKPDAVQGGTISPGNQTVPLKP